MPNVYRFPQLLVTQVASLLAMPLFPTSKVPHRYFWRSQQCHPIAQETNLFLFIHPPHEVTSHVSLREAPSLWPCFQCPLGEPTLTRAPVRDPRRPALCFLCFTLRINLTLGSCGATSHACWPFPCLFPVSSTCSLLPGHDLVLPRNL